MVRIIKTMQSKHSESLSPFVKDYRDSACAVPLPLLPAHLATFPSRWPFPRGDLYHWIPLLNRFDEVLEKFCNTYKLDDGPQTEDFTCTLLKSQSESKDGIQNGESYDLEKLGFTSEGDRELVESVLDFSRILLQNCGNRSIYASSAHLNSLLNTTSLSLLESTLRLGSELAQRYQAALKRMNLSVRHVSNALLINHYNINLQRVQQLALPFSKTMTVTIEPAQPTTPSTPSMKGKEKAYFNIPQPQKVVTHTVYANDLVSMVKGGTGVGSSPKNVRNGKDPASSSVPEQCWEEFGDVKITYYPKQDQDTSTIAKPPVASPSAMPTTPTPIRRASNLGPHGQRSAKSSDESTTFPRTPTVQFEEPPKPNFKVIEISSSQLRSVGIHKLLRENIAGLPKHLQYELLTLLRVANALISSVDARRQILSVRLLAITNLAYIHPENTLTETILKQDGDEPRRLQLVYQLAELVHPPAEGDVAVPKPLQTLAFTVLEALSGQSSMFPDVCAALNTNVNHGILLYVVRKAVAGMSDDDAGDKVTVEDEWRDSIFGLLSNLAINPRTGGDLITAGLIPILVEILGLRTYPAEHYHPMVLNFLDTIMYSTRDAFQTLVNADGLDAVSNLIVYEVKTGSEIVAAGNGIEAKFRSPAVDYEIPFAQQQTLKWLFKFIHHMMSTAGGYGGNFDRLLRNLIDSSQLLGSLRQVIGNASLFGSNVWSNAVSILNDFINNEPTSFAVIAEAGLSKGLLEAVTGAPITMPVEEKKAEPRAESSEAAVTGSSPSPSDSSDDNEEPYQVRRVDSTTIRTPREGPLARGILPSVDVIGVIPQAFGALCLNNSGMKMFQASKALEVFFEIFESPEHVKCMDTNKELPSHLGSTFDELIRHHPQLKDGIVNAIINMIVRVNFLCTTMGKEKNVGAKLMTIDATGKPVIADAKIKTPLVDRSLKGKGKAIDDGDIEMEDVDVQTQPAVDEQSSVIFNDPEGVTPYISAVGSFLVAMLGGPTTRSEFSSKGGLESVLDLADSVALPVNFGDTTASRTLHQVIATLSEAKPHLVMPSLLRRAQAAADILAPFANHTGTVSFFAPFFEKEAWAAADNEFLAQGTDFVKALVNIQSLVKAINLCLQTSIFNHRSTSSILSQINVDDQYIRLVRSLGPLVLASLREVSVVSVPATDKSEVDTTNQGGGESSVEESTPSVPPTTANKLIAKNPKSSSADPCTPSNYDILRDLFAKILNNVPDIFQSLGKALVPKRSTDSFQKQYHSQVADALVESFLGQLKPSDIGEEITNQQYIYWFRIVQMIKDMLIETSRQNERPVQAITLVVQAFKDHGGLEILNRLLEIFADEIRSNPLSEKKDEKDSEFASDELVRLGKRLRDATEGAIAILKLYGHLITGKNVQEAIQTMSLATRERDRSRPDHFSPAQLIVELRMAILPVVRRLWGSDLIEKGSGELCQHLIDVLRNIAAADCEIGAVKRTDKPAQPAKPFRKTFKPSSDHLSSLTAEYDADLATEALYRCNNHIAYALEYCRLARNGSLRRNSVPDGDLTPPQEASSTSRPGTDDSGSTASPDDATISQTTSALTGAFNNDVPVQNPAPLIADDIDDHSFLIPEILPAARATNTNSGAATLHSTAPVASSSDGPPRKQVTVDDLNEEREAIRSNLIDKCLDAINAHGDVTFDIAELITTVVNKAADAPRERKNVGETLVIALMSFAGEDDLRINGNKVAAYAHLLALMLRDKSFYVAAVGELKDNLSTLLGFVKLSPTHTVEEPSPWIAQILLIIEMLLSEDARPVKAKWTIPKEGDETQASPTLEIVEPTVGDEERSQLLEAIVDILPRIGKDEPLALAVLRILVILTRERAVAQSMGDKKNIQRLFVMAKQLAGSSSTRIQSPLMLILRHIIEDDETVKQIMRSEIKAYFESSRTQRGLDEKSYLRGLAHTALRCPRLFVEVTNEIVKFSRWASHQTSDGSGRHNILALKEPSPDAANAAEDTVQPTVQATEDLSIQDIKPSTEAVDSEMIDVSKPTNELKFPVVENPDGVIHFLLSELVNYKEVEDKEPPAALPAEKNEPQSNGDVTMGGTSTPNSPTSESAVSKDAKTSKPAAKQEFKSEDHPIYIYRCFLLQCLTELLSSYNRTKIEFINFKRGAPPQAITPSKPRSGVVNYLLYDLIPIGTLDHVESIPLRKKLVTSSWADSVLCALLCKTGEHTADKSREPYGSDNEPDLLFVRKFVLENILKAYREASTSNENLDVKYARMLSLADLMNHIMNGKEHVGMADTLTGATSQKQLRRIMFEKGYVAALTASIADVDLNFPGAKRAVKYILRPLKILTTTAVTLSDLSLITGAPGQNEEDEIESATSLSEPEDEREETPDLFRNSTLGMFEPGREEDSSSDSDDDDEEMYEGEYDDEMDYDEEGPEDDEDNISDEEEIEGMEGMGPIEGLSGDHGVDVEVIMEEDDDEGTSGEDDDDEHDSQDDDAHDEILEEVEEMAQDEMDDWESDDEDDNGDEEEYEAHGANAQQESLDAMDMNGPLGHLVRALGGDESAAEILERMEAGGIDPDDEEIDEEADQIRQEGDYGEEVEDDDEEDDEDDMDEEEMLFDQYPMDGPGAASVGWGDDFEPPTAAHRRPRGGFSPFPALFPGGPRDPLGGMSISAVELPMFFAPPAVRAANEARHREELAEMLQNTRTDRNLVPDYRGSYRSHRPGGPIPRPGDDGTNPLFVRTNPRNTGRETISHPHSMSQFLQAMGAPGGEFLDIGIGGRPLGESPAALLEELIRSLPHMPGHISRHGHAAVQLHISAGPGQLPPDIQAMLGVRPPRVETRRDADASSAVSFTPLSTTARWLDEAKIIFGSSMLERAYDITNSILALLVPPAIEADKQQKAAQAELARKAEEERKKVAEEERIAKEKKEAEEKLEREQKEAEERAAAERAAAEALAARGAQNEQAEGEGAQSAPDAMDGVETENPQAPAEGAEDTPAADRVRITTIIRGQPFDITDLGIDADFLAELPEEIREEVIMSAVAERRSQAAATGAQPSDIDQEFLDALPDDIREEIIQQERQDRRRREREERNRQNIAANGGVPPGGDMDAATILATLPPALRNQVLMEQDEETLAMLPQEIADQARAAMREQHPAHGRLPSGFARRVAPPGEPREVNAQRPPRRAIVQMLDKSGVATLLRLMFIFQQGSLRSTLNSVLQNICMNRHNRNEVLGTVLHILQDGSLDMSAVERSFAHLTLRAKQPKDAQTPKTPQPLRKTPSGLGTLTQAFEASPLMVLQQCLTALVYLNQVNPHIPAFFLTEHDTQGGLKRSLSRKGKGKESKAAKYPLNSLLSLLGRDLVMESSSVMETLSTLLNMITSPLQALQRKQKEAEEAKKVEPAPSVADTAASATSPETTTTNNEVAEAQPHNSTEPTAPVESAQSCTDGAEQTTLVVDQTAKPDAAKEEEKKPRPVSPPVIPEQNLKLVINIFVARECSSKTFRETLSTIKNLSTIPNAKAIFGRELILKAQGLGEIILTDLDSLLPQIQKASTGTEIQGVALAKFSPGSSDQNKLLRVLTALDHLFDPKREKKDKPDDADTEGESSQLVEKQDLLSTLYENPTFGKMWERLSACLSAIRQREHMLNVATILLPLIESLMVVCKNTTLKEVPLSRGAKDMVLTSPPPESQMENLFFTFTEDHRKILNDLVRHTPKLMSGTFSLLVNNPKVLDFDNKRNFFSRSIHSKVPNSRQSYPPLQLSLRRDQVFHDSFKSLYFQTGDQMKYGKLSIRFHGEEGVDAGGVTREWFQVLSRQMFDPGYALFIPVSSDRTTFHPNQLSSINEEHLMFFKFIGRIIGKALYEGRVLDCHFSRAVYKRILGKSVSLKDMESLDPDYFKSLIWMLDNDITDIITETFSVDNDKFGVVETIDFIPNGRNIAVTEENKAEYVRLMVEWKLTGSVKEQLDEFLKGFHDIIPASLVAIFNEQELELLISGLPEIDVDDWKSNTEYHNYSGSSPQIQWFWRAVRSYDKEERAKLLQFVTGTSKVPLNGFKELEGMNGFSRFNIHRDYGNKDRLPSSHTCFNQLDLPEYESYEQLRQQVLTAITAGSDYFGFA